MASKNYSKEDIMAMQKDAERRVMEMQARQKNIANGNCPPPSPPPSPPVPPPPPMPCETMPIHKENPVNKGFLEGIIPDIKIDEEKALIIFLLIILARNGADMKMLIALGYLLM